MKWVPSAAPTSPHGPLVWLDIADAKAEGLRAGRRSWNEDLNRSDVRGRVVGPVRQVPAGGAESVSREGLAIQSTKSNGASTSRSSERSRHRSGAPVTFRGKPW